MPIGRIESVKLRPIPAIWIGGALLALILYRVGPDHALQTMLTQVDRLMRAVDAMLQRLTTNGLDMLRAVTLALYGVFTALGIQAARHGLPARRAIVCVTILLLLLVAPANGSAQRWFWATILVGSGASAMTHRLRRQPV